MKTKQLAAPQVPHHLNGGLDDQQLATIRGSLANANLAQLVELGKATFSEMQKQKEEAQNRLTAINNEASELRNLLAGEDNPATATKTKTKRAKAPKSAPGERVNPVNLKDAVRTVIKSAGRTGATREEIASAVKVNGYKTKSDDDVFANSVYVSGIHKLAHDKEIESVKTEGSRVLRYRMKK